MANATMPTSRYSSGEFIAYSPFLQALAAFGEADERDKRDNGHHNDNQVKHTVPPYSLDYGFSNRATIVMCLCHSTRGER